jgi:hypothetical protein
MSKVTWVDFTASIEKQIDANGELIFGLARAAARGDAGAEKLLEDIKGNNTQLRAIAKLAQDKLASYD